MLTMRPLDAHGKWQGKTQKEYLCRKADEERGFTAQVFLQAKADGWEEQFKYRNTAGVSAWLTPTQAAREPGGGAKGGHVGIVVHAGELGAEGLGAHDGAYALDLVGSQADTDAGATDQDA